MNKKEIIMSKLMDMEIPINNHTAEQFIGYYELLDEWNQKVNLTAISEYEEVVTKHFMDSLLIVKTLTDLNEKKSLIDVGTGAGFPGIPIKLLFPEISLTLLDASAKRINFINIVLEDLKVKGCQTIHGRSEIYAHEKNFRERYDVCVSRAVAPLNVLAEYCLPFTRVGGVFVAYKAKKAEEELEEARKAIALLGGEVEKVETYDVEGMERVLITLRKVRRTEGRYPRKEGVPKRKPL